MSSNTQIILYYKKNIFHIILVCDKSDLTQCNKIISTIRKLYQLLEII